MNGHWMGLYQSYYLCVDLKFKMATISTHDFIIGPRGKMFKKKSFEQVKQFQSKHCMNSHSMDLYQSLKKYESIQSISMTQNSNMQKTKFKAN